MKSHLFFISFIMLLPATTVAQERDTQCDIGNRPCVLKQLESTASQIENMSWRDQTYRELAKTYAFDNNIDAAIAVVKKIQTPDTQALTIRGIGMAAAANGLDQDTYDSIFSKLHKQAAAIEHPPSHAIALTYIAMAQAFAGDNEGAWKTAGAMENDALRHKAFGETAEIQAEQGDFSAAMISIGKIESESYRNKAYGIVAKLLADQNLAGEAYEAAQSITNPYKKSEAIQYILDIQKPREVKRD